MFQSLFKLQLCLWSWKSTLSVSSSLMASPSWRMWWTIIFATEKSPNSPPSSGFLASHSYLYSSLRGEVVCADRDPFAAVPETKLMVGQRKQKTTVGLFWWQSCFLACCGCTAPQTASNVVVLTKVLYRMRNMRIITIFPHRWAYEKASWNKASLDKKDWKQRHNTCHLQMQGVRFVTMWQHKS